MNRDRAKNLLSLMDLIRKYADGQQVQFLSSDGSWNDTDNPSFTYPPEKYRIKPRPLEGWVTVYEDGTTGILYPTKTQATWAAGGRAFRSRTVFMREVENP